MTVLWNPSYEIGNAAVDASAKALFDLTQQLATTDDWSATRQLIVNLYKEARSHFALEEALMQQCAYPALAEHAAQHQALLGRLEDRSMDVGKGHMNKKVIVAVMADWAQTHVTQDDAALAQFIQQAA